MSSRERGIIFGAASVRAILDGSKSVTRRVVKLGENFGPSTTPGFDWTFRGSLRGGKGACWQDYRNADLLKLCPYGTTGETWLWVRETWYDNVEDDAKKTHDADGYPTIFYRADPLPDFEGEEHGIPWRSPIFMPRWASRLTLEVCSVRAERLQEISGQDARAEGLSWVSPTYGIPGIVKSWDGDPRESFRALWDSINGKRPGCSWSDNPFVWRIDFRRVTPEVLR